MVNTIKPLYYVHLTEDEMKNIKKGDEGKDLRFFSFEELFNILLTPKLLKAFERQKEFLKLLLG